MISQSSSGLKSLHLSLRLGNALKRQLLHSRLILCGASHWNINTYGQIKSQNAIPDSSAPKIDLPFTRKL